MTENDLEWYGECYLIMKKTSEGLIQRGNGFRYKADAELLKQQYELADQQGEYKIKRIDLFA